MKHLVVTMQPNSEQQAHLVPNLDNSFEAANSDQQRPLHRQYQRVGRNHCLCPARSQSLGNADCSASLVDKAALHMIRFSSSSGCIYTTLSFKHRP